jgi:hypothetical protein
MIQGHLDSRNNIDQGGLRFDSRRIESFVVCLMDHGWNMGVRVVQISPVELSLQAIGGAGVGGPGGNSETRRRLFDAGPPPRSSSCDPCDPDDVAQSGPWGSDPPPLPGTGPGRVGRFTAGR